MSKVQAFCKKRIFAIIATMIFSLFLAICFSKPTHAAAKKSTLHLTIDNSTLSIALNPSSNAFGKTSDRTIYASTDNYSGYTLSVASSTTTSLVGEDDSIESISSAISESTFSTDSTYNNKWGYKPSQYINGQSAVVQNTDFRPIPSTGTGETIDITNAANSVDNTYTLAFGAKIDYGTVAGTYSYTYNIMMVGNPIVYTVYYNANTAETVSNMPSPNPQTLTIPGGTPTAESYASLSDAVPTMSTGTFAGWCDEPTTGQVCAGTTYTAGDDYPIDQTVGGSNIQLYAIWAPVDPFPTVWSQLGACEFHGYTDSNITGSACQDYSDVKFIDTGIALYNNDNYQKDYQIHFQIDSYDPNGQETTHDGKQHTFVSDKLGSGANDPPYDGKAPGIIVRRNKNNIAINSKYDDTQNNKEYTYSSSLSTIDVYRINGKIYQRINNEPLVMLQDVSSFDQQFGLTTWFGAYPSDGCTGNTGACTNAKRILTGTLSNMYIKLGTFQSTGLYTVTFNPAGGTFSTAGGEEYIVDGSTALGSLPTVTRNNYIFEGWYTGQSGTGTKVRVSDVPSATTTYYAHWVKSVSQAIITNTSISLAPGGTETINITNSSEIENHTFVSDDTSVATVNSSTGEVTAVGDGTATITMTGSLSHDTRTITVTVTSPAQQYTISFDSHGGAPVTGWTIDPGDEIGTLPAGPAYSHHFFQGWFTQETGGTQLDGTERPSGDMTCHAQWKKDVTLATISNINMTITEGATETIDVTNAAELEGYSFTSNDTNVATVNSSTGLVTAIAAGSTTITMTGTISQETKTINVIVNAAVPVCKLATAATLHTATISGHQVTYGQVASSPTPAYSDAYDCDVDNDDNYNASNERFYYVGQNGNNAVLVAYNSFEGESGWASQGTSSGSFEYVPATTKLPSTTQWDNPELVHYTFTDENDTPFDTAARFLTYDEVVANCGNNVTSVGGLDSCEWLMENSAHDSNGRSGIWLMLENGIYHRIHTGKNNRNVTTTTATGNNTARPVIEIPYTLLEKFREQTYNVYFDSMGGSSVSPKQIVSGHAVGQLVAPTMTDYQFFGWYTSTDYTEEVTADTIITGETTFYARWVYNGSNFPIVWSEINACTFNGNSAVTGDDCEKKTSGQQYIETGLALFSDQTADQLYANTGISLFANDTAKMYEKDFEIGFTILEYSTSSQVSGSGDTSGTQATLINSKQEVTGYPGFVVRRSGNNFQLTAKFSNGNPTDKTIASSTLKHVKIVRRNGIIYYSWNDDALTEWWNANGNTTRFNTTIWFGSAAKSDGTTPMRPLVGKLTDMYIKIGTYEESAHHKVTFNAKGGTASEQIRYVTHGSELGALPTMQPRTNYTFNGWYTAETGGTLVDPTDVITSDTTIWAHWTYNSSLTPVQHDVSNAATRGYNTLITNFQPQVTAFTKNTTDINQSTWGVSKSTLYAALQNNFESNDCMQPASPNNDSTINWGGNHTVNCTKPDAYDTGTGTSLDVYLYDTANQTHDSTPVAYADASDGVIHNMVPGKSYYWENSNDNTMYGVVTAYSSAGNRRWIDAGSIWNTRDLGGLPVDTDGNGTIDGTLKYEKLIRGARIGTTVSNVNALINLGVDKEYDLAKPGELGDLQFESPNYVNDTVIHYNFEYPGTSESIGSTSVNTYEAAREAVTDIMTDVVNNKNVFFHCRVGADRTGTLAYLLEGLLGVPDEYRYEDYELTSLSLNDRTRYYDMKTSTNNKKFLFMMGYILEQGDIYNWYMQGSEDTQTVHPDADLIQAFRTAMIDSI